MYIIAMIAELVDAILGIIIFVVLAQVIASWLVAFGVLNTRNRFVYTVVDMLDRITQPILRPIRRLVPPMGGLDLSPLILLLVIQYILRPALFHYVILPILSQQG
jgi:YggT family protein